MRQCPHADRFPPAGHTRLELAGEVVRTHGMESVLVLCPSCAGKISFAIDNLRIAWLHEYAEQHGKPNP